MDQPYVSMTLCCITCNWQCESVIEVLFKKSNNYIPNCNEFSLHVNKYALPCMYYLTYHISSLDSAQANATCVKPTKRPAASPLSTLHSWHFYVSDCTVYCWCGWWRPSSNKQLGSSVLSCILLWSLITCNICQESQWPVCQVSRLDRHRHIIAQACLNWMKIKCFCRETRREAVRLYDSASVIPIVAFYFSRDPDCTGHLISPHYYTHIFITSVLCWAAGWSTWHLT